MKTAFLIIFFSTFASANSSETTANFFEVDTSISDIRPEKQVAEEYRKKNTPQPADPRRSGQGKTAAEQMSNARSMNPAM